jgi:hypothetical protein
MRARTGADRDFARYDERFDVADWGEQGALIETRQ